MESTSASPNNNSSAVTAAGGDGGASGVNTSRHNIPAVCRIPGRGTGFLVSPGLIMTSTRVVGTKHEAARLTAVFFEGGKRPRVEVALLPQQFYFAAAYPEHLDYCLVACETSKIFNVTPVKLPLVASEWPAVREGDLLFAIEHPVFAGGAAHVRAGAAAAAAAADAAAGGESTPPASSPHAHGSNAGSPSSAAPPSQRATGGSSATIASLTATAIAEESNPTTVKRWVEILRRRDDRMFAKPQGSHVSAGCPCFNDSGALVGLMSQVHDPDSDALTCSIVSIVTAVKHLFANGRIARIQQEPLFSDVWSTWAMPGDTARLVSILMNFTQKSIHKEAATHFFEHCLQREHVPGVVACGGTRVLLDALRRHRGDCEFGHLGLRALWSISFSEEDNRDQIRAADGISVVLDLMSSYPDHESLTQYAIVVLYNLTLTASTVTDEWAQSGMDLVFAGAAKYLNSEVLQKFAVGFFNNVVRANIKYGEVIIQSGILRHCMEALPRFPNNEYLHDNGVRLVSVIAQAPQYQGTPALSCCVTPVIEAIVRFDGANALRVEGSHALWGLGTDPRNRIAIFNHERGVDALRLSVGVVSATRNIA